MVELREEWRFLRLRAAQLYEEGNAEGALKLLRQMNLCQVKWLQEACDEYEQTENC